MKPWIQAIHSWCVHRAKVILLPFMVLLVMCKCVTYVCVLYTVRVAITFASVLYMTCISLYVQVNSSHFKKGNIGIANMHKKYRRHDSRWQKVNLVQNKSSLMVTKLLGLHPHIYSLETSVVSFPDPAHPKEGLKSFGWISWHW